MDNEGKKKLGQRLVEAGLISGSQLEEALAEHKNREEKLGTILVEKDWLEEEQLIKFLSSQMGYPVVNLDKYPIQQNALNLLTEEQARQYDAVPILREEDQLTVAMKDPLDVLAIDDLKQITGYEIDPVISRASQIEDFIDRCYSTGTAGLKKKRVVVNSSGPAEGLDLTDELDQADQKPAVSLAHHLICDALEEGANNIHLDPREHQMQIQFRVDGVINDYTQLPVRLHQPILSRLKLMAEKSVDSGEEESYLIIRLDYSGEDVILRLNTTTTRFGEKMVIKVCRGQNYQRGLTDLGLDVSALTLLEDMLSAPRGLLIYTGPAASGRTTSLYASLRYFADTPNSIITVEAPIEYELDFCTQIEVSAQSPSRQADRVYEALDFDPDILMVSQMGEPAVARATLYAAATGCKVFSSYYSDNAVDALYHLANTENVDRYQLANSVVGVVAQRLVRLIDPRCRAEYTPNKSERERLGLSEGESCYQPAPPGENISGYKGMTGIFQVLPITDDLRFCILEDKPYKAYQEAARKTKLPSLRKKGVQKIRSGATSVEEVLRCTFREDFINSLSISR
ncbi:MAG: GspE/PulE family protein [bacterium]